MANRYNEHISISAYDIISNLYRCHKVRYELPVVFQGDLLSYADGIVSDEEARLWEDLFALIKPEEFKKD